MCVLRVAWASELSQLDKLWSWWEGSDSGFAFDQLFSRYTGSVFPRVTHRPLTINI